MAANEEQRRDQLKFADMIPERRKNREIAAAFGIVVICSAATILFTTVSQSSGRDELHRVLILPALICLGAVISTVIDRLCSICEEIYHLETRYNGNKLKMISACLSGVRWSILSLTAVTAIAILYTRQPDGRDIGVTVAVLFGLMTAPLIRLFYSNTLSQVEVSRILEGNEKSVANGLAWSYYFGYLQIVLPELKDRIQKRNESWKFQLSSEKLYILLPLDCCIRGNIQDEDKCITKENDGDLEHVVQRGGLDRKYTNKAHRITFRQQQYHILLEYTATLDTLEKMSIHERIKTITEEERIDQVKMFCQTLGGILEDPLNKQCQGKCELVIYDPKTLKDQEGGLAEILVQRIEENKRMERRREERNVPEYERVEEQEQQMPRRDLQEHSEYIPHPMAETGMPSDAR